MSCQAQMDPFQRKCHLLLSLQLINRLIYYSFVKINFVNFWRQVIREICYPRKKNAIRYTRKRRTPHIRTYASQIFALQQKFTSQTLCDAIPDKLFPELCTYLYFRV